MAIYDAQSIEKKWQDKWYSSDVFKADDHSSKPKKYILDMFPYPSGAGLHVGHPESYTATDILSRYYRMNGYNVLHPMGWDAFGLPAENHAIKTGIHPKDNTADNIENFRRQIKSLGFSYDWSREINTSAPEYYRWTQWWFQFLYKNGLAYKKSAKVNWCDKCQTVIANEQVVNGNCERCDSPVIQKDLEQWFFKITEFSQDLIDGLENIDWPASTKTQQLNWIGRSEGAEVIFNVGGGHPAPDQVRGVSGSLNKSHDLIVYTTRPDTLFGATYVVLAPEHSLLEKLAPQITNWDEVKNYQEATKRKSDLQRTDLNKDKSGVRLAGVFAINPVNQEKLPVFIADYVLATYGTGAIMAVPAHDQRDWDFAKKYDLPMIEVLQSAGGIEEAAWEADGEHINSDFLNGLNKEEAIKKINQFLESKNLGKAKVNFRLRDWLVSRQRYWGAPIPVIYCKKCGEQLVDEKDLPVILPDDVDFRPTGESPLTRSESFHKVTCPKCGGAARRESDTMDTFVCSSWYYLRFIDPHNAQALADKDLLKKWLPVDVYLGGAEHTVLHLLYARFFMKALQKYGGLNLDAKYSEPFYKLRHQGMILGEDGNKMSKSKGNVINPDEVVNSYGADTLRLYEMFMGALEDMKPWNTKNILGVRRFLEKVWLLPERVKNEDFPEVEKVLHRTIKKVSDDILVLGFNTAISQMMIFANAAKDGLNQSQLERFLKILSPFAPHISEEVWSVLGHEDFIAREPWPTFDEAYLHDDTVTVGIQINGKVRDSVEFEKSLGEAQVKDLVLAREKVQKWLEGKEVKKFIYIPGKIINIVMG